MPHASQSADLRFDLGSFAATSAEVSALSQKGREFLASMFGAGCVGVTLPKSRGEDFLRFAKAKGQVVA